MDKIASLRLGPTPGCAARLYPARRPLEGSHRALVLWLHGGRFTSADEAAAQARCALLTEAGADVVALDYPLAPTHPFPAALDAAFAALQALAAQPGRFTRRGSAALFVGGEEAGGNIAAALALMARDQQTPVLAGQVLMSPMLDPQLASASMREGECGGCECPFAQGWRAYLGDGVGADHPYAAPLKARRLGGLAPALVLSLAGHPLSDESRRYAAALRTQGTLTRELTCTGTHPEEALHAVHAFLRDAAREALSLPG